MKEFLVTVIRTHKDIVCQWRQKKLFMDLCEVLKLIINIATMLREIGINYSCNLHKNRFHILQYLLIWLYDLMNCEMQSRDIYCWGLLNFFPCILFFIRSRKVYLSCSSATCEFTFVVAWGLFMSHFTFVVKPHYILKSVHYLLKVLKYQIQHFRC